MAGSPALSAPSDGVHGQLVAGRESVVSDPGAGASHPDAEHTVNLNSDHNANFNSKSTAYTATHALPPPCPHVLVFTAPRHGSSWFVNNVENCTYSQPDGTFGTLFGRSELWVHWKWSVVADITAPAAVSWLLSECSIKIFPVAWNKHRAGAEHVVFRAHDARVPIVLLARDVRKAFRSFYISQVTDVWERNINHSVQNSQRDLRSDRLDAIANQLIDDDAPRWRAFRSKMTAHLNNTQHFLDEHAIPYDRVVYDDIVDLPSVTLPNAKCVIRNCNFA